MTTTDVTVDNGIMDFSSPRGTIKFRIDDDIFEAHSEVAAISMLRFASEAERMEDKDVSIDEQVKILQNMFHIILTSESATRFIRRLEDDARPIGIGQFTKITTWLLEQYGLRPTESDSPS